MELKKKYYDNGNLESEWTVKKVKCQTCDGTGKSQENDRCLASCKSGFHSRINGLFKGYHENGQLCSEHNYKNGNKDGVSKNWYENGQLRKKCKYENGKCIYLEEYHLNGTLVRKGSYEVNKDEYDYRTREIGDWEYFDAKSGQKLNKNEYNNKWYENLPDEFTNFDDKLDDEENGVEIFYQVIEYTVNVYKNDEIVAEGRLEYEVFENIWSEDYQDYERQRECGCLIINGEVVDEEDYDEVVTVDEYEHARFTDFEYANFYFENITNNMLSKSS